MSCFTCHNPQHSFESGMDVLNENRRVVGLQPKDGSPRVEAPTAMLPLINLVFRHDGYTWSGMVHPSNTNLGLNMPEHNIYVDTTDPRFHFRNLESFAWLMIALPHEIHGTIEESVDAIARIPMYPPLFEAAFGTPEVTIERIGKAIAQFVRTLISANSQFDRFRQGLEQLCDSAFAGWLMFESERADCFHCHGGRGNPLLTTGGFANNALEDNNFVHLHDRKSFTGLAQDRGRYLIPTLRNIALTAPYMHDGRFTTLEQVIDFYSSGLKWSQTVDPNMKFVHQGGVQLTNRERRQLILFLETLTDTSFITNPAFQNPFR
jgi:cytochrome c peroxidase